MSSSSEVSVDWLIGFESFKPENVQRSFRKPPKRKPFNENVRRAVLEKFGGRCAYCGCPLTLKTLQVDHVHSHMLTGGDDSLDNLFPACRQCNFMKDVNSVNGFRRHIMKMVGTMHNKSATFRMLERYGFVDFTVPPVAFWFEKFMEGEENARRNAFRRMKDY